MRRPARREADAARQRHADTEREINRHAARKSALTEAHSRLNANRAEAEAAHESAASASARLALRRLWASVSADFRAAWRLISRSVSAWRWRAQIGADRSPCLLY